MIIKIVDTCMDYQIRMLVKGLKTILNIIQVGGPVLTGIFLIALLIKLNKVNNNKRIKAKRRNKQKKEIKESIKKCLIVLLVFLIGPIIINMFIKELDDMFQFSICWNYDGKEIELDKELMDNNDKVENKNEFNINKSRIIFLGDSRTVHMYSYLAHVDFKSGNYVEGEVHNIDNEYFICKSGMGLSWMNKVGVSAAEEYINDGTAFVILMGVNDLYNLNEYIKYINNKYKDWVDKGAIVYFVSVNPCSNEFDYLNDRIISFNEGIKQGLNNNIKYIDSYSFLKENGYKLNDGLHYDQETSIKIYNFIKNEL